MPSRYRLKTKKQKVPDYILVVVVLVDAGNDVVDTQLLFGVLQQRDKRPFTAVRQVALSDCHIKPVLPEHSFPLATNATDPGS